MIFQLPSCNLFTLHACYFLWRDTTSETMAPGPIFLIDTNFFLISFIIVSLFLHFQILDTFKSQVSARPEDWQPFGKVGARESLCVMCRFHACWRARQQATLPKTSKSYWFDSTLVLNQGKLPLDRIIPSSWGSQRGVWSSTPSRIFLAPLAGISRSGEASSPSSRSRRFLALLPGI